ncbi:MAG: DUF4845 domain-containing protein [Proteobacteria bacterium]|nr:DUF4845 domain-containing protein [Pseudomonadota bacterium]
MKHISQRQGGMTALGIFIILAMLACFFAFGLRMFPLYNQNVNIKKAMESVINQPYERRKNSKDIRKLFLKAAKVNSLYEFDRNNISDYLKIKKSKDGKKYMSFTYQNTKPLFMNYHLMIDIDESMELPGAQK